MPAPDTRTDQDKNEDRMEHLVTAAMFLVGIFYLASHVWQRDGLPVVHFAPASEIRIEAASPGRWATADYPLIKHRDCDLDPSKSAVEFYYENQAAPFVVEWQTNGPPLNEIQGAWQIGRLRFRMPMDVTPGSEGAVVFRASYDCLFRDVQMTSPAATFRIPAAAEDPVD